MQEMMSHHLNDKRLGEYSMMYDRDDESICSSLDGKDMTSDDERHLYNGQPAAQQITRFNECNKVNRYCRFSNFVQGSFDSSNNQTNLNNNSNSNRFYSNNSDSSFLKMRCKQTLIMASDILSSNKQVRWADDLVDVHTFSTPRIRGWELLRRKLIKTIDAIKQDIEF